MNNTIQLRSTIKLDFFERIKVLFGKLVVVDSVVITDQPFEKANYHTVAFVETQNKVQNIKNKADLETKVVENV